MFKHLLKIFIMILSTVLHVCNSEPNIDIIDHFNRLELIYYYKCAVIIYHKEWLLHFIFAVTRASDKLWGELWDEL